MKKILTLIILVITALALIACEEASTSPVVLSKLYTTTRQANNLIELYNPTDNDIDLSSHALNFYTNGSLTVSSTIPLSGIIEANSYFLIGSGNHNVSEVEALFDFTYETGSLPYNGNDAIELVVDGNTVDLVGMIGLDIDFSRNLTMIRLGEKEDYEPSSTFDMFNFVYYLPDMYQYLKNDDHEIKTLTDLYAGPRLEERYLTELTYVDPENNQLGGGGAVIVTNNSVADGDTAFFAAGNGFGGGSVRYFYLNTPEVDGTHVNAEPWGYVASKYNKEYLLNNPGSKEIRLQSLKGYSLTEGFGRSLALVWINGYLSQFLIVAEGLSEDVGMSYSAYDLEMSYKNVPYLTYLRFAEQRAKINGWATKGFPSNPNGEKSPDWNYDANNGAGALSTTNPVWTPKLLIPWE